jgi:hypothetical protein
VHHFADPEELAFGHASSRDEKRGKSEMKKARQGEETWP